MDCGIYPLGDHDVFKISNNVNTSIKSFIWVGNDATYHICFQMKCLIFSKPIHFEYVFSKICIFSVVPKKRSLNFNSIFF